MEDGKKRHLFQLESKRQELQQSIPDQCLNYHLQYMKQTIVGFTFPKSIFKCCLRNKYNRVKSNFKQAYEQLPTEDQIYYYRKYLECSLSISKKTTRFPQTAQYLQDHPIKKQPISIQYRYEVKQPWKTVSVKIDPSSKTIKSSDFNIDLHHTFLVEGVNHRQKDQIVVIPWNNKLKGMEIRSLQENEENLIQRIALIWNAALEENIVNTLEGLQQKQVEENQNDLDSQRSLDQRLMRQASQHISPPINTFRQVNLMNYLTYKHPTQSFPPPLAPTRLRRSTNIHYFLQGQYQINNDGEMVVTNKLKLEAQGSVMKFIIKKIFSGGSIFKVSLPVSIFGEESNLSLLLSSYRHAPVELDAAAIESDPLQRFLKVVRFALTCPACYVRCDKPFNPILGETYQSLVEGTLFYGQQISHHPPISSIFIKGRGYTMYGSLQAEISFGINTALGNNKGWLNISFDENDIKKKVIRFNNIPGEMSGLVLGSRKLNLKGIMYIVDEENLLFCRMAVGSIKIQKKVKQYKDSVQGMVVQLKKGSDLRNPELISSNDVEREIGLISGRWLSQVYFKGTLLINTLDGDLPQVEQCPALLPSDYSLRQDIIFKRKGLEQACQKAKQALEELQRNDRKLRQKDNRQSLT